MEAYRVYDLTHPMHEAMPVYPGKGQPAFEEAAFQESDGYREMRMAFDGHTGTHIDAPAHMLKEGKTLDQYPVSRFSGKGVLLSVPPGTVHIGLSFLKAREREIAGAGYLLLRTGWSRFWEEERYMVGFPVLTEEAAQWLTTMHLKGIGLDAISVDPVESDTWPVHHILFGADMVIVENLVFSPVVTEEQFLFCALPLPVRGADGSPVRALALVTE